MQKRSRPHVVGTKNYNGSSSKKSNSHLSFISVIVIILAFVSICIVFTVVLIPALILNESERSLLVPLYQDPKKDTRSLSQKLVSWIPRHHLTHIRDKIEQIPDWKQEFWTPIDLEVSGEPVVTLCKLNFQKYSESPHMFPMFRDLEMLSNCRGSNRKKEKLSVLLADLKSKEGTIEGRVLEPSAFVFHESRVGSTLIANEFASDPWSMVFSESGPPVSALLHCEACDRQKVIQLFRDIITLMGRSPFHKRLFFKFQSVSSTKMEIALEAFPNTTWAYVFRNPVQTMMSHLDPAKGSTGAPCLRSMRDPPKEVSATLKSVIGTGYGLTAPKEAWCAAHLNMLCTHALEAYEKYNVRMDLNGKIVQRGLLINYDSLPGIIPRVFLSMAGIEPSDSWLKAMSIESTFYSKGRRRPEKITFKGDSEDKEERSTRSIQQYSKSILEPSFERMKVLSLDALQVVSPDLYQALIESAAQNTDNLPDWTIINTIPTPKPKARRSLGIFNRIHHLRSDGYSDRDSLTNELEEDNGDDEEDDVLKVSYNLTGISRGHSKFPSISFQPWIPFANTHNSKSVEIISCPDFPEADYPHSYSMVDITNNWNTDTTEIPPFHYDSLCHFDYQNKTELQRAYNYRSVEVPFVVYNVPEVDAVVRNWSDIDYLHRKLGSLNYRTETAKDNHFMYWSNANAGFLRGPEGKKWKPPTEIIQESFEEWMETAIKGQNKTLENRTFEYFRVSSDVKSEWLFEELPFFKPKKSLFIVEPREQKGIHCRFGMRSVIAEAHFDGSRNVIALFGGLRRYVLSHPNQCKYMHMYPRGHPSGRHSAIDWSKPDVKKFPNWLKLQGNEVIMQPGDVLYLPTYWIHYIISLNVNYQCNTRSGRTSHFDSDIRACGF